MPTEILEKTKEGNLFETPIDRFSPPRFVSEKFMVITEEDFERMIDERVEKNVRKIFEERGVIKFRKINDIEARKQISNFILEMKREDVRRVNILDIISNLSLPPEQVERIMEEFEKEKKVTKVV